MIIRVALLSGTALMAIAAAPKTSFNTTPILPPVVTVRPQTLVKPTTPPGFEPAPLPNRDAFLPTAKASKDASLAAGVFMRRDQYRGESLSAEDSAQALEDRRVLPGGGVNLSMPLQ